MEDNSALILRLSVEDHAAPYH